MSERRETVAEYLERTGLSDHELAARAGVKPKTVQSRKAERERPMPRVWFERIDEWERGVPVDEEVPAGRAEELPPRPPPGARIAEPPEPTLEGLDLRAVAGYIEGAYKLGAHVLEDSDPLLAQAIDSHARQAGEAWARWIESEPRVAALLERMMVGTPLGEVIAVHVGIGFSYFLARSALSRARAEERRLEGDEGGADYGPEFEPQPAAA